MVDACFQQRRDLHSVDPVMSSTFIGTRSVPTQEQPLIHHCPEFRTSVRSWRFRFAASANFTSALVSACASVDECTCARQYMCGCARRTRRDDDGKGCWNFTKTRGTARHRLRCWPLRSTRAATWLRPCPNTPNPPRMDDTAWWGSPTRPRRNRKRTSCSHPSCSPTHKRLSRVPTAS